MTSVATPPSGRSQPMAIRIGLCAMDTALRMAGGIPIRHRCTQLRRALPARRSRARSRIGKRCRIDHALALAPDDLTHLAFHVVDLLATLDGDGPEIAQTRRLLSEWLSQRASQVRSHVSMRRVPRPRAIDPVWRNRPVWRWLTAGPLPRAVPDFSTAQLR